VSKPSSGAAPSSARSSSIGGKTASTARRADTRRAPAVPDAPGTARIIAIANQKGGVGKSTTAVSLGAALAELGYRVLVVDLDPQGNASTGMGIRHEARDITVYDVVVSEASLDDAVVATPVPHLDALPSTIDLAGAEIELVSQFSRETRLKRALAPVREGRYDFILLDCPPSLGLLTVNALTAAEELIVPIQCEYYALEGLGQLLRNVSLVQQNINQGLRLSGIVMTMFDPRTKLSEQVVDEVQKYFGDLMYDVIIPRTVRLSEAPGFGQPITVYDPKSKGAECYRQLAREVALRPPPETPMPSFDDLPTVVLPAALEAAEAAPIDDGALDELPTVHEVVEEFEALEEEVPAAPAEMTAVPDARGVPEAPVPEAPAVPEPPVRATEQPAEIGVPAPPEEAWEAAAPVDEAQVPTPAEPELVALTDPPRAPVEEIWDDEEAVEPPRVRPVKSDRPPGQHPERRIVVIDEDTDLDIEASQEPLVQHPQRGTSPADPPVEPAEIGATLRDDEAPKRRWRLFRKGGE
jgi:chromosome partitioning protein